ncbi:MAG TPA: YggT family protein [Ktedonosporobacter sp.]|nr:YggT family protein [Ktedonosporobacter sp.]
MTISFFVATIAQVLILAIIIKAILSWLPGVGALAPVVRLLNSITEPILSPIRSRLPLFGGIDFSPLIAILLISVVESLLLTLLAGH